MIRQKFKIYKEVPFEWWFIVFLGAKKQSDYKKVYRMLKMFGATTEKALNAVSVLEHPNNAYTFTNFDEHITIIALAEVTSKMEFMNSVTHELQHATAHLCEYFMIDYNSEKAGYIQGEIGEQLYDGVAMSICPCCRRKY